VNTAQRLQSAAEESQIIITQESYEKVKQSFQCRPIGNRKLKNKEADFLLYEVLN
jgi:class 3 adenylate cyclase